MILDYEHFGQDTGNVAGWFNAFSASISADGTGFGGFGRYCTPSGMTGRSSTFANTSTLFFNGHFWVTAYGTARIFQFTDSGTAQFSVWIQTDGKILVKNGNGGTTLATSTKSYNAGAWYFLQVRAVIHNTAGEVEVRLNGETYISITGVDTTATANNYANGWAIEGARWCNILVYDTTGASPTTWTPIDVLVQSDKPTGAGASTGFTPSAGSNWQNVDEAPNDGDTTYNDAASAVTDDLYAFSSSFIPAGVTVYAMAAETIVRKTDAGTNTADVLMRSGTTTQASGSPQNLTTTFTKYRYLSHTDPNTAGSWTPTTGNAMQVGVRRTA